MHTFPAIMQVRYAFPHKMHTKMALTLCMHTSMCIYTATHMHTPTYMHTRLCISISMHPYPTYLRAGVPVHLSVPGNHTPTCLRTCTPTHPQTYAPTCLQICTPAHPQTCAPTCLQICTPAHRLHTHLIHIQLPYLASPLLNLRWFSFYLPHFQPQPAI